MSNPEATKQFVIGRDIGGAGRVVRVLAGLLNLAAALSILSFMRPVTAADLGQVALATAAVAAVYTIVMATVGERLVARMDPWLAALALVLPLAIVFLLPFVPDAITVGAFTYIAISQFVQAAIGYGGCEIVGIPTLILRRRYTVYCALNGADLVERWLRNQQRWVAWVLAILAFALTMALGAGAEVLGSVAGIGQAAGFFAAYIAFLVIGLAVSRVTTARTRTAAAAG